MNVRPLSVLSVLAALSGPAVTVALDAPPATSAIETPAGALRGTPTFTRILDAGPVVTDSLRLFGGSWADWNADGNLDQYVVGEEIRAYPGDGTGGFGSAAGDFVSNPGGHWYSMGLWADWNEDGWLDLYLANFGTLLSDLSFVSPGPDRLFSNSGPPDFTLVPVPLDPDSTASVAPSWVDYDRDGDLDLCVSSSQNTDDLFYRNDGGSFTKLNGLPFQNARAEGAVSMWVDVDDDGDEDFYVVNHGATNEAYKSLLVETGDPDAFETGTTGPLVSDGTEFDISAEWCDYDNDGDLDAYIPVASFGVDKLFRNEGGGTFTSVSAAMTIGGSATFGAWGDADNDGDADLFVGMIASGVALPRFFRNEGDGSFTRLTSGLGSLLTALPRPQAGQWGDIDNDGDLDLYVITFTVNQSPTSLPAPCYLYRNDDEGTNGWLTVSCTGTISNRSAIGARVHVVATIGGTVVRQLRVVWGSMAGNSEQPDSRLHFGLGDAAVVDSLIVEWPSGLVETLTNVAPNQRLEVVENVTTATPGGWPTAEPPGRISVFPNPFASRTTIEWGLSPSAPVTVRIYDVAGREVRTAVRSETAAALVWDGTDDRGMRVPAGVYYIRLSTASETHIAVVTRTR